MCIQWIGRSRKKNTHTHRLYELMNVRGHCDKANIHIHGKSQAFWRSTSYSYAIEIEFSLFVHLPIIHRILNWLAQERQTEYFSFWNEKKKKTNRNKNIYKSAIFDTTCLYQNSAVFCIFIHHVELSTNRKNWSAIWYSWFGGHWMREALSNRCFFAFVRYTLENSRQRQPALGC